MDHVQIPEKFVRKFLMLPEASEQGAMRLDYRSDEHVHYLNNIEEDSRYKRWRANLNEVFQEIVGGF
jgi:UDP-glucose:glycoprotein glucosyltransferase